MKALGSLPKKLPPPQAPPPTPRKDGKSSVSLGASVTLIPNTAPFLLQKFEEHVIGYINKYLVRICSLRTAFDKIDLLRREADHYKKKVEALAAKERKKSTTNRGDENNSKLDRNREKLHLANLMFANASQNLMSAVDEICDPDKGWRELQSVALKIVEFER